MFGKSLVFVLSKVSKWMNQVQKNQIKYLETENQILREQLGKKRIILTVKQKIKLSKIAKKVGRKHLFQINILFKPDTILGWYHDYVKSKWNTSGQKPKKIGRPSTKEEIENLVVRMARENSRWGYTTIRDRIWDLGFNVSRTTVANILNRYGIEPSPVRKYELSWKDFIKTHKEVLVAGDFFTVDILKKFNLMRFYVLFFIHVSTREVKIAGITEYPTNNFMVQMSRNMTDPFDGFFLNKSLIILDNDILFTKQFKQMIRDFGMKFVKIPRKSPNLNAYAERFIRSIREECLNHLLLPNEKSLRHALREYEKYYNHERTHQGINGEKIKPYVKDKGTQSSKIIRVGRLGNMLNHYYKSAC